MVDETRIEELLLKWEENFERGTDLPAQELAGGCPELTPILEYRIKLVRQLDRLANSAIGDDRQDAVREGARTVTLAAPAFAFLRPGSSGTGLGWLGPFEVKEKIGQGGMGWVFRAEDHIVKRQIALKVIQPGLAEDPKARACFLREAQSAAAIEHEHIIPVYQVGEDNGVIFIAMPLLKGQSLASRLNDPGPIAVELLVQIAEETAAGLAAAHERGVIHRDIKPANLFLEERPGNAVRVKIVDFGLARPLTYDTEAPTQLVVGTPGYISPEQLYAQPCDARTDLFALGCVLYLLVTRRPAFPGKSIAATLQDPPPPPVTLNPAIPAALSQLIMRMLARNRADRPASAMEILGLLRNLSRDTVAGHDAPTRTEEPAGTAPIASRPRAWPWMAGIVALLLLGAGVAWRVYPRDHPLPVNPPRPDPIQPIVPPATLRAELEINVWKKGEPNQKRSLTERGVLPLQAKDEVQIIARTNRPAYFYLVQVESSGEIAPMYPWVSYDWERRKTEQPRDHVRLPDDPVLNAAELTDSPSGVEAIYLFVRDTPLSAKEQGTLKRQFDAIPRPAKQELFKGAVLLSDRGTPTFSEEADRGRLALPGDALNHFRAVLQTELPQLFADTRVVCYSFKSEK